ncbi:MAG: TOMM precursor leader peptide-binding protein [Candidatus Thiodiazotropha endolucinida]
MIDIPEFQPHLRVHKLDDDTVLMVSEENRFLLRGDVITMIAPLIDGKRSSDEIANLLSEKIPEHTVFFALLRLEQNGHIIEAKPGLPKEWSAFWSLQKIDPLKAHNLIRQTAVSILSIGNAETIPLQQELKLLGFSINSSAPFKIVITDEYSNPEIDSINKEALQSQDPWMLCKLTGKTTWIGPVFTPGNGACWKCLDSRLRENRRLDPIGDIGETIGQPFSIGTLTSTIKVAIGFVGTELAKWIICPDKSKLTDRLLTINNFEPSLRYHTLSKNPACSHCGNESIDTDESETVAIKLTPTLKINETDGGYRTRSRENTWKQLEPHISPITGIISDPEKQFEEIESPIHVYFVKQNSPVGKTRKVRSSRYGIGAAGKGMTDLQARVSCVAEAVERYSSWYRGNEPTVSASYQHIGAQGIHPYSLLNISDNQYLTRRKWNLVHKEFNFVPEPFDESETIKWTKAWSLTKNQLRYIPTAFCYYQYRSDNETMFCRADSNGCASGNTLEEAILQGLFEVVERDATAIWWYNMLNRPQVDLTSLNDPYVLNIQKYLHSKGRLLYVLDTTTDINIPCFCAVSTTPNGEKIFFGQGAHLDARVAISRAITEMNQSLVARRAFELPEENRVIPQWMEQARDWYQNATLDSHTYLIPLRQETTDIRDYPSVSSIDITEDISKCVGILSKKNLEVIVLNLTLTEIGFPVVKVIVPGMRHVFASFANGRLYDVPVERGWKSDCLKEEELNSIPYFL